MVENSCRCRKARSSGRSAGGGGSAPTSSPACGSSSLGRPSTTEALERCTSADSPEEMSESRTLDFFIAGAAASSASSVPCCCKKACRARRVRSVRRARRAQSERRRVNAEGA